MGTTSSASADASAPPTESSSGSSNSAELFRAETAHGESTLHPTGTHQYTLIYLHGFTCAGEDYIETPYFFRDAENFAFGGLKVVCPTAAELPITCYEREPLRAWYDYLTDNEGAAEDGLDLQTLQDTRARVEAIIRREVRALGERPERVLLGGCSQGCGTALHVALLYPHQLGGFVGTIGHLLACTPLDEQTVDKRALPLYLYNGLSDPVMDWGAWVQATYQRLIDANFSNVNIRLELDVSHDTGDKEGEWIIHFLSTMIPVDRA